MSVRQNDVDAAQPWSALYAMHTGNQVTHHELLNDQRPHRHHRRRPRAAMVAAQRGGRLTRPHPGAADYGDDGTRTVSVFDHGGEAWVKQVDTRA